MSDYWKDRFVEEENRVNQMAGKEIRKQQAEYDKAITRINQDIEVWYNRIAKNNDVSLVNAKEMLNKKEHKEFKWTVEEYIKKGSGEDSFKFAKELENASAKYHIERLEAMKLQVRTEIEKLYNDNGNGFKNYLDNLYKDQYNHTFFEIAKGTGIGIGSNMYKLNDKLVNTVISNPWASDGKHFSDRIWEDKEKLLNTLHTEMTQAFIRGDKLDTLIEKVVKRMNVSRSNVARLVYTESAAYASKARIKTYEDLNIERYEIVATLDSRTSEICQGLDGKVFDFKDYEIGTTAPPFHVNCRTTTAPYFEDGEEEKRAARDKDGKTYYVPSDMTYDEWFKKYQKDEVEKNGNDGIIELTKLKEIMTGKDYEEYKSILNKCPNENIKALYNEHFNSLDKIEILDEYRGSFTPRENKIVFGYADEKYIKQGSHKFETLAHEAGHFFDNNKYYNDLTYLEIEGIQNSTLLKNTFPKIPSSSDMFLDAVRKDIEILRQSTNGFKNFGSLKEKLSTTAQSSGVQDFLDGICDTKKRNIFGWGHGKGYYDREYNAVKKAERLNDLKDFYNSVRYDVKTQQKLKDISRNYRTASEVWANITQAVTLENETGNIKFIEEYMPNSLKTYLKIINNRK